MSAAQKFKSDRHRLLVADDDRDARLILEEFLSTYGYTVSVCKSGAEAIALLRSPIHFDGLLLDLRMPEKTGYDVLRELRTGTERNRHMPVIVISAVADQFWGKAAAVFSKPVPLMALLGKLDEIYGVHGSSPVRS